MRPAPRYRHIFIAYADCGTGGLLDAMLADEGVERLPGAHCYEFYAGAQAFAAIADEELGTFFLTDFLARNFDRLVIKGLGLDRHPELLPAYFGNYTPARLPLADRRSRARRRPRAAPRGGSVLPSSIAGPGTATSRRRSITAAGAA